MGWLRYLSYFLLISAITWVLTHLEVLYPGSLRLQVFVDVTDTLGTSEYSPIEMVQPSMLAICGLLLAWVALHFPAQRALAIPLGGLALVFLIRELDYFLDRLVASNFSRVLIAVVAALLIVYVFRHRRRLTIALARIWPSPGLALLFAGAAILFAFVQLVGDESLWQSILGDDYRRIVMLAVEEFIELIGYLLWLVGTIEYAYQASRTSDRAPAPAAVRRRQRKTGRRT